MKLQGILLAVAMLFSGTVFAQEYGLLVGVHQTTADASDSFGSVDGKFNFKLGLTAGFELSNEARFRTGILYNQRHVVYTVLGVDVDMNFDYIDIPANFQYNFNPMVGVFGGLVAAINVNDEVKAGGATGNVDAEGFIPLLDVGVNFLFEDMIGFDVYYERGLGDISRLTENYSTFGANFIYWF
jgi:hypothetical protein